MSEHVHEWDYIGEIEYEYICKGCTEQIHFSEVIRRLNATERLSAEDARELSSYMEDIADAVDFTITENKLLDYASALKGENEKS